MSTGAQAVWFFLALLGFIFAALRPFWSGPERSPVWILNFHPGWAGAACIAFVLFWIAVRT